MTAGDERRPGRIPSRGARWAAWACVLVALAAVVAGTVLKVTGAASWSLSATLVVGGFALGWYGVYIWVRLSD